MEKSMEKSIEIMNITIKMHFNPFGQRTKAGISTENAFKCMKNQGKLGKIMKNHEKSSKGVFQ